MGRVTYSLPRNVNPASLKIVLAGNNENGTEFHVEYENYPPPKPLRPCLVCGVETDGKSPFEAECLLTLVDEFRKVRHICKPCLKHAVEATREEFINRHKYEFTIRSKRPEHWKGIE